MSHRILLVAGFAIAIAAACSETSTDPTGVSGGLTAATHESGTVVVWPGNMQGWAFAQETPTGSGQMVSGPATPPAGSGSANLVVDNTGGEILGYAHYQGVRLDEITELGYSTYRTSGASPLAISLQFNLDRDLTDGNTAWQGRLVYEPYFTHTVLTGTWQTWNPQDDAGTGNWWTTQASVCPQSNPCTWSEFLAAYPNAGIHATLGAVGLKAGGGWAGGFDGNTDALTIGVNGTSTTYDFELVNNPSSKDACKNGGHAQYGFKNQGQCVRFVETGKDSR